MRCQMGVSSLAVAASMLFGTAVVNAQTSSTCNPLNSGSCPPDPALGKSSTFDFSKGSSDQFTAQGNPTYDSNGVSFTIAKSGDSPQITSKFYIMFGKVELSIKAAPGAGIVSSAVLQSDDLDEIDWEWLGADTTEVQSNYFGKGQTTTYNRGAFHADPGNQDGFKTYTIDWTSEQVVWQIDGTTVRALRQQDASGQYPQTPMQLKIGAWSGGDSSNAPGTIEWARGPTNYANGPYSMQLKSATVTDYSTGTQYKYNGNDGSWQSIVAVGGKVNPSGSGSGGSPPSPASGANAPTVTSASPSMPYPFEGTHRDTTSTFSTPNVYPWVASPTTFQTTAATQTTYPGLPAGWTVSSSGKVIPPSSAPAPSLPRSSLPSSPSSPPLSPAAAGGEVRTSFNEQGFPTVITVQPGASSSPKHYNDQGFLITSAPAAPQATGPSALNAKSVGKDPQVDPGAKLNEASSTKKDQANGAASTTSSTSVKGYCIVLVSVLLSGIIGMAF
ncbi:MAG: hypothetical protein M4579_007208 [Chaenotheca gracillima]|nr:MAG: hypothetical protein M4579_007208 [Chaenotheca gracillima]